MSISPVGSGPAVLVEPGRTPAGSIDDAIERAGRFLLGRQAPEGYWCGELEADTSLESDTVKLMHLLGRVDPLRQARLVRTILKNQLPDGGWPIYQGGPAELNVTVKAYVALRLAGHGPQEEILQRARAVILRVGGLERVNSFEKVYLALFGLYPWDQVPALPPELILLPRWFPFNIYEISCWSRTILVPLSVVYAGRPAWVRAPFSLEELWRDPARKRARATNLQKGGAGWRFFFLGANRLLKLCERSGWKPLRELALRRADRWITERLMETDGLGAIFPAMLNAVFALKSLGYSDGDPLFERSLRELERLDLEEGDDLKVQPCFSPVWDTALAAYALAQAAQSVPGTERDLVPGLDAALERAVEWLLGQEIRIWGDWVVKNPGGKPAGWAFEFRNPFYPDVDDTGQVLLAFLALKKMRGGAARPGTTAHGAATAQRVDFEGAFRRGLEWVLSMQNRDGGWSSFDKDNDRQALTHFPFADHNAMLDPSAADITGRMLELAHAAGLPKGHPAVRRGVRFLRERQEADGTWFGRWGVNYTYGSWLALRGLLLSGEPMEGIRYQQAGRWLVTHQNPDGGWGESCRSYDDPAEKGRGVSTASQTAWALMALMSLGWVGEPAFRKGLEFLLRTQREEGDWAEEPFTGTGFPRVFYLKYHLYRVIFPLLALSEARQRLRD